MRYCFRIAGLFPVLRSIPIIWMIPKELDGTDVAVVKGEIGVAENGAIWIPQTVKYKAIYFISEKLVILLDRNKIVDTMYDAYRELDGQEYQFGTFISGPSKTADIEQAFSDGSAWGTGRVSDINLMFPC